MMPWLIIHWVYEMFNWLRAAVSAAARRYACWSFLPTEWYMVSCRIQLSTSMQHITIVGQMILKVEGLKCTTRFCYLFSLQMHVISPGSEGVKSLISMTYPTAGGKMGNCCWGAPGPSPSSPGALGSYLFSSCGEKIAFVKMLVHLMSLLISKT